MIQSHSKATAGRLLGSWDSSGWSYTREETCGLRRSDVENSSLGTHHGRVPQRPMKTSGSQYRLTLLVSESEAVVLLAP